MRSFPLGTILLLSWLFCSGCTNHYEMYNELRIWEKQNENTPSISAPIPEFPHRIWISPDDGNGNILV